MAKITWDGTGARFYQTGIDQGVLYPLGTSGYTKGVAWNGLTSVQESPSGGEATSLWADNIKYLNLMSAEEFGFTIEAYTYPEEFEKCDGSAPVPATGSGATGNIGVYMGQQSRQKFGFCYRTKVGNDQDNNLGYKLHFIYGCSAQPSSKQYQTVNDSPEAITFSWECKTEAVGTDHDGGYTGVTTVVVDSTKCDSTKLKALEAIIYGTDEAEGVEATEPRFPMPDEIISTLS